MALLLLLALPGCREQAAQATGAGMLAPLPPRQWETTAPPLWRGHFELTPRAEFAVTAQLLSKRRYGRGRLTPLSPWDYALAWGAMSDPALARHVSFTQGDRFLFRHALLRGMAMEPIERLTTNVHLVPVDDTIADRLGATRPGEVVTLRGKLVDVYDSRADRHYPTSRSRTDRGAGACEILLVESLESAAAVAPQ